MDLEREKYKLDYDISKPSNCWEKNIDAENLKKKKLWTLILFDWDFRIVGRGNFFVCVQIQDVVESMFVESLYFMYKYLKRSNVCSLN